MQNAIANEGTIIALFVSFFFSFESLYQLLSYLFFGFLFLLRRALLMLLFILLSSFSNDVSDASFARALLKML